MWRRLNSVLVGVVGSRSSPPRRPARTDRDGEAVGVVGSPGQTATPDPGGGRGGVLVGVVDWLESGDEGYGDGMRSSDKGVFLFSIWLKLENRGRSGVEVSSGRIRLENAGFLARGDPSGSNAFVGLTIRPVPKICSDSSWASVNMISKSYSFYILSHLPLSSEPCVGLILVSISQLNTVQFTLLNSSDALLTIIFLFWVLFWV